jgi:protein ImuA
MIMETAKEQIITKLRQDIMAWEGFRPPQPGTNSNLGLGPMENAFPNAIFPTGAIHEFISERPEDTAACGAFIAGLSGSILKNGGICVWVSWTRRIYPPALKLFGLDPDRIIFVDVPLQKDILWVTEEALKCEGIATVICETGELSFMESRRLQLAVEQSHVTGFVLRKSVKKISTTACVARWKIQQRPSELRPGMPGVGFPRWQVELLKVRNGKPGQWLMEWKRGQFMPVMPHKVQEGQRLYA